MDARVGRGLQVPGTAGASKEQKRGQCGELHQGGGMKLEESGGACCEPRSLGFSPTATGSRGKGLCREWCAWGCFNPHPLWAEGRVGREAGRTRRSLGGWAGLAWDAGGVKRKGWL